MIAIFKATFSEGWVSGLSLIGFFERLKDFKKPPNKQIGLYCYVQVKATDKIEYIPVGIPKVRKGNTIRFTTRWFNCDEGKITKIDGENIHVVNEYGTEYVIKPADVFEIF